MSIEFSTLIFSGSDVIPFLQGQLTADLEALAFIEPHPANEGLAGICNNKGRLIATLWLIRDSDEQVRMILPSDLATKVEAHLTRYIFRSKVTIEARLATEEERNSLPKRLIIPWLTEAQSEKYIPQMVSLDSLKGISFTKGCYTGQEIIARMHFLGTHKRRLAHIRSEFPSELVAGATITTDEGERGGEVLLAKEDEALAVLYLDAAQAPLMIEHPITVNTIWNQLEEEE